MAQITERTCETLTLSSVREAVAIFKSQQQERGAFPSCTSMCCVFLRKNDDVSLALPRPVQIEDPVEKGGTWRLAKHSRHSVRTSVDVHLVWSSGQTRFETLWRVGFVTNHVAKPVTSVYRPLRCSFICQSWWSELQWSCKNHLGYRGDWLNWTSGVRIQTQAQVFPSTMPCTGIDCEFPGLGFR